MNRKPIPARVRATLERRQSSAAGIHPSKRQKPRGGRQGGRQAAIREQWGH